MASDETDGTPDASAQPAADGRPATVARRPARRRRPAVGGTKNADRAKRLGIAVVLLAAIVALVYGSVNALGLADGTSTPPCPRPPTTDLAPVGRPRWRLANPRAAKLVVTLDSYVQQKRTASVAVHVSPVRGGRDPVVLPRGVQLGAIVTSAPKTRTRSIGFPVVAHATRARDGRSVRVTLCVWRPQERTLSGPGRYAGTVRVAGPKLRPVSVPVVVTIKGAVPEMLLVALLVSIIGALGPFSSRPSDTDASQLAKRRVRQALLSAVPVASGLFAGLLAAYLVYTDDPTFGAQRGADTVKLVIAAYAASTAGLAATATPTRALRGRTATAAEAGPAPAPDAR